MLTCPRSGVAGVACTLAAICLVGGLASYFVDIDQKGEWSVTPFRIHIDYHADITYENVNHNSLTYVSRERARELQDNLTAQDASLAHFWEKSAMWVANQNERSFPMHEIGDEYAMFMTHYFDGMNPTTQLTIEIREKTGDMVIKWLLFTE